VNAQNSVTAAEYFFDNDPGQGSGFGLALTSNTIVSASQLASVSSLSLGRHVVYVRLKSQKGNWGAPVGTAVTVSKPTTGERSITGAEYFFDSDPGIGLGQSLSVTSGLVIAVQQDVSDMGLNRGLHTIYIRLKDSFGYWSAPLGCKFLITDSIGYRFIKQAEYFLDRDPGQGNGNFLPVSGSIAFQNIMTTASIAGFSDSSHCLFIRFLDDKARWSAPVGVSFCVVRANYIAGAEFFIDSLGLSGTGRTMSALDTVFNSSSEFALARVDTSNIHAGYHKVFVHVRSSDGHWSSITKDSLFFNKALTIVESNTVEVPKKFSLSQNYPNPFNPSTTIQYALPVHSTVRLIIYNLLGQVLKILINREQQAGYQSVVWNANVSSGFYFYRLEAVSIENPTNRFIETKKMLLLK
jgi:hypothetical protein